uniref:Uncharacterized protein n=1 Tax=Anguilla anguilla TaxID=7936 RepID=A0A0E9W7K6_ANGAN
MLSRHSNPTSENTYSCHFTQNIVLTGLFLPPKHYITVRGYSGLLKIYFTLCVFLLLKHNVLL